MTLPLPHLSGYRRSLGAGLLLLLGACGGPGGTAPTPAPPAADTAQATLPADTVRDGHQRVRDAHGRLLMEGDVRNGLREGLWVSFHPNGAVASRNEYHGGVLQGLTVAFRPNGALYYEGQHANGHPVGTWTFHDGIGTLVRTVVYDSAGVEVKPQ